MGRIRERIWPCLKAVCSLLHLSIRCARFRLVAGFRMRMGSLSLVSLNNKLNYPLSFAFCFCD